MINIFLCFLGFKKYMMIKYSICMIICLKLIVSIHFARMNYDYRYIYSSLCFGLKNINTFLVKKKNINTIFIFCISLSL